MTEPTAENVDNTNAVTRALVAALVDASDLDVGAVLAPMVADGQLSQDDADAAADVLTPAAE